MSCFGLRRCTKTLTDAEGDHRIANFNGWTNRNDQYLLYMMPENSGFPFTEMFRRYPELIEQKLTNARRDNDA
jgi:hypothetical protein